MLALGVLLTPATRSELERLQQHTAVSVGIARRARMVLLRADAPTLTKPMADTLGEAA
jgi:hypothetical protein